MKKIAVVILCVLFLMVWLTGCMSQPPRYTSIQSSTDLGPRIQPDGSCINTDENGEKTPCTEDQKVDARLRLAKGR